MPRSLTARTPNVEDQQPLPWSDPEAIETACIHAIDELLGHDVDRIAGVLGVSRRELNKQRERRPDRRTWLHRLCEIARAVTERFGPERTAAAARIFSRACGHDLAHGTPAASSHGCHDDVLQLLAGAMREFGEVASGLSAAALDGVDRQEATQLIPEVDEAVERLQAIRNRLVFLSMPRPRRVGDPH